MSLKLNLRTVMIRKQRQRIKDEKAFSKYQARVLESLMVQDATRMGKSP